MDILEKKVDEFKDDLVKSVQELIRIKSVKSEPKPGMPFGEGAYQALEHMLDLSERLGFKTKNVDGYAGHAEYGEGDDIVGVLVHLDVVPEGTGWTYPPYGAEIHRDKIYGRGAIDDKGPAVAALYALKALKESGAEMKRRVRIIFGTDEESGWEDMDYYMKKEETPMCGFSPDADFPIINSEKGIIKFKMEKTFTPNNKGIGVEYIKGGLRVNMVPDYCEAKLITRDEKASKELKTKYEVFTKNSDRLELIPGSEPDKFIIKAYGVSAHGSTPEKGVNAVIELLMFLNTLEDIDNGVSSFISFVTEKIGIEVNGESLGIDFEDEISGKLIFNLGVINLDEKQGTIEINIRYPIKFTCEEVMAKIKGHTSKEGIQITDVSDNPPLYVSEDNFLIKKLKKVYMKVTGQKADLISIGGGTYARAIENAVAFGPLFPGKPELAHEKNEYVEIEDLILSTKIYAKALFELASNI